MRSKLLVLLIVLAAGVFIWQRSGKESGPPPGSAPSVRTVDPTGILEYGSLNSGSLRVRTTRDVIPGGFSLAMVPMMVDWERSNLEKERILLRNINDGGNPVSGITVLRTAEIDLRRVQSAEFMLVPLGGPDAFSHGQIRFVFEEGAIEFLEAGAAGAGESDAITDLVFSWEAWRPPGVDFSVLDGMNPENYELSLRVYSGRQRFLEDALGDRDWKSVYTLNLPGGQEGVEELFRVCLAMGDGAARHSLGRMLEQAEDAWLEGGPDVPGKDARSQWEAIRREITGPTVDDDDPRIDMSGSTGYQTLLRSCATMALYSVNVTVMRLIEGGKAADGMRPTSAPELDAEPEWMKELASANFAGLFARAPRTLKFARANPYVIPSKIPPALEEAGLLEMEDGKPRVARYSMSGMTPWGHRDHLLIR